MSDCRDMVVEALASREATLLDRFAGLRTECATWPLIALAAIRHASELLRGNETINRRRYIYRQRTAEQRPSVRSESTC